MDNVSHKDAVCRPPVLEVTDHHGAIYWSEVKCSFEARPGKIKYADTRIIERYYFTFRPDDYVLEILQVTASEITFVVKGLYCSSQKDTVETIRPGEVKKFSNSYRESTRLDGDNIDYEVEDWLEVKWTV